MIIYYTVLIILVYLVALQRLRIPISENQYMIISSILLFSVIAFRDISVGVDTRTYEQLFMISGEYVQAYKIQIPDITSEFLFYLTAYVVKSSGADFRLYLILTSFTMISAISLFFKRYSNSVFLSYWLYVTLGLFGLSMSGMRQMLALSIVLLALRYLEKGRNFKYVIWVVIAGFFHFSAFIMLPILFLRKVKIKPAIRYIVLAGFIVITLIFNNVILSLLQGIGIEKYVEYSSRMGVSGSNPLAILVAIAITFISAFLYRKTEMNINETNSSPVKNNMFDFFYLMSCINVGIMILSVNNDIVSRVGYYFFAFNLVLLPNAIMSIKNKNLRVIFVISALIISLGQFIISTPNSYLKIDDYLFFWT